MRYLERKDRARLELFLRAIGASWYDDEEDNEFNEFNELL